MDVTDEGGMPAPAATGATPDGLRLGRVGLDRPWAWLAAGWRDFARAPGISLAYGAALSAAGLLMAWALAVAGMFYLILPLVCGFMLVGPLVAVGLYEVSRRLETGSPVSLGAALRAYGRNATQIAAIGLVLMLFLMFWVRVALLLFALFFSQQPPADLHMFVELVFFSASGLPFLVTGTLVGACFAAAAFAIGAVSLPMLLDRDTNVVEAVAVSVAAVLRNWQVMAGWAGLIVLFTAAGLATGFLGLAVALPLIAHASWHAYRDLVPRGN